MTDPPPQPLQKLRVAIVGAGAAGLYATGELLQHPGLGAQIDIFERLPTPWGLVRAAVAPDHPQKKLIVDRLFDFYLKDPRVRFFGNVDIGKDIGIDDLRQWYHAVIITVGASGDTKLGIPGETLPGSYAARDFVGYYNGHPDFADLDFDLSCPRAVIVGNGNVALDVARMLTLSPDQLAQTDMPDHALAALAASKIREIVILGRRGPEHAAYNAAELEEFIELDAIDIAVAGVDLNETTTALGPALSWASRRKMAILRELAERPARSGHKRIVFRFCAPPVAFSGDGRVERIELGQSGASSRSPATRDFIDTRLVFRACGYRGMPADGLPFDHANGVIANRHGRVSGDDGVVPGVYVAGWIKRGCRGIIGSNKFCARETVARMIEDFRAGTLRQALPGRDDVLARIVDAAPSAVSLDGWLRIDHAERRAGRQAGRSRVKIAQRSALMAIAAEPVDRIEPQVQGV